MNMLGVLVGRCEKEKDAERICSLFDECPYKIVNTVEEGIITLVFSIPSDHRWWLESVEGDPENTLGLSEAEVFFSERVEGLDGYIQEMEQKSKVAPCGTNCEDCNFYLNECKGCPSTILYLK